MLFPITREENLYSSRKWANKSELNFLSKVQLTKKKDRILIKDPISNKWNIKQKTQGWFYSREYIYIYFYISESTAFLLQGLIYYEEVKLRRYNLKIKE